MAGPLPHLPDVERLSPRVIRILGGNPGKFTLQGTNTYLIGSGARRILLDTGAGEPAWLSSLKSVLRAERASISTTLISHWHPDHVSGVVDLLGLASDVEIRKHRPDYRGDESWRGIADGEKIEVEGATLRAVHCPGHTEDHMTFVLEEEDAMFTADNVLGHGTAVFEDLKTYLESLERMRQQFAGRAYPGHGAVIEDGRAKIEQYVSHRRQREKQIVQVLGSRNEERDGGRDWSSMDVVRVVYRDVPESLHIPAEHGVLQVLRKLEMDGRVSQSGEENLWQLSGGPAL